MAVSTGTRLGSYEFLTPIGAGGMGEVWKARDTKLGRDVALKILPELFASDPDRLSRFQREAQVLASLNHPNIAAIYGIEDFRSGGSSDPLTKALVLELVDGPTLADRIVHGSIPIEEALPIAKQIAEALEAAHAQGIIHQDLKPANVKVKADGMVKVLDFGLAKLTGPPEGPDVTVSSTMTSPALTRMGVMLGTAAYMSPEQAKGRPVDNRADVWAFGCVLFEMLTGRRAFAGATVTETLAAVLERQPEWQALPRSIPAAIRRLLHRCLEKEPKNWLHAIADARLEIEDAPRETTVASWHAPRPAVWLAVVAGCAASLGLGWLLGARSVPATVAVSRWLLDVRPATALLGASPGERSEFGRSRPSRTALALSPNGRTLAFTAQRDGTTRLYVRALDKAEAAVIAGTDGADGPFFSPDGNWVGFWAGGAIRKVALAGGPPVKVSDTSQPWGATWPSQDAIVYASPANGTIWTVAAAGGMPRELTKLATGEFRRVLPQMLPREEWLLFTAIPATGNWEQTRVVAQSLDTGEQRVLLEGAADARYVPTGHLVYMRLGNLMAAPFDAERAQLTGPEAGMIEGIMQSINSTTVPLDIGAGQYAFSSTGTFAYVAGELHPDFEGMLYWIRRGGSPESIPTPPRAYANPRLSPDGRHVALATWGLRDRNLWRYDLADGIVTRLTTEGRAGFPVWSPDGTQILFALGLTGPPNLFSVRAERRPDTTWSERRRSVSWRVDA